MARVGGRASESAARPGTVTCIQRLAWDALHRLAEHGGKCEAFHGHRYVAEIECSGELDDVGRVGDFSVIKSEVGGWINANWDHTGIFARSDEDHAIQAIAESNSRYGRPVFLLEHPPSAENIAAALADVARDLLRPHHVNVISVRVWETPNSSGRWVIDT